MSDYDLAQNILKAVDIACHKAYANGIEAERSRIIKLLEEQYEQGHWEVGIIPNLIALIKGENK